MKKWIYLEVMMINPMKVLKIKITIYFHNQFKNNKNNNHNSNRNNNKVMIYSIFLVEIILIQHHLNKINNQSKIRISNKNNRNKIYNLIIYMIINNNNSSKLTNSILSNQINKNFHK